MTLMLELTPEMEEQLRQEAARQGQPLEAYALARLQVPQPATEPRPFYETATPEEQAAAYLEWARSHTDMTAPPIPAEALRREHLYED